MFSQPLGDQYNSQHTYSSLLKVPVVSDKAWQSKPKTQLSLQVRQRTVTSSIRSHAFTGQLCVTPCVFTQTCHSSRFNRDIPIFQYKSRSIPISRFHVKIRSFCFISKLEKQKGVSFCCVARVSKPTKFGLKINAMIG